ncbi:MAG: phosphatase PAP2 family protein [Gammaproteobacteria bacterium]|nr:phosphatase PAP2 family protein [Gammaproteobacteria bacterium]MBU1447181.1 phosphatase PAP2 family protein [Gammaproteobacteria bacterium]
MANLSSPLQQIKQFDVSLCVSCNRLSRSFTLRNLFRFASRLGDGVFWYVLMISFLLQDGYDALPAVLHMLGAGLTGALLYKLIKGKTLRPRPFNVYPAIKCVGKTLDQFSFPSGHTLHSVVFTLVALAYYPGLFWLLVPFTGMVALSRPILGLHYPSDVLAGAALGALIAWVSFLF